MCRWTTTRLVQLIIQGSWMNAWSFEVLAFSLLFFPTDGACDSHIRQLCSYIWPSVLCLCGVSKCHGEHHEETKYESVLLIFAGVLAGIPATNFLSSTSSYMTHSVVSSASNWTLVRVTVPLRHCSGAIFEVIFVITSDTMHFVGMHEWEFSCGFRTESSCQIHLRFHLKQKLVYCCWENRIIL
jgi:hypothetical protein